MATSDKANCVIPGQMLGDIDTYTAGPGTYIKLQHIYASVVGVKLIVEVPCGVCVRKCTVSICVCVRKCTVSICVRVRMCLCVCV